MLRKVFRALVVASATALALGATSASAATVYDNQQVCTADARWELTLPQLGTGHADVTWTNIVCDGRASSFDSDGARFSTEPSAVRDSGPGPLRIDIQSVIGGVAFAGVLSQDDIGLRGVVAATTSTLNASYVVDDTAPDGTRVHKKAEHRSVGTCGQYCFLTEVHAVHSYVRAP